jgi:acetoacetyl-CoA synthetase
MNKSLWQPSEQKKQNSLLEEFNKFINLKSDHDFKTLWKWTVDYPEDFWSKFWDYSKIIGDKGNEIIKYNKIFTE